MKLHFLIVLFCFYGVSGFGQNSSKDEVQKLNDDLVYLKEVLYKSHPATFKFISEDSLDYLFDSQQFIESEKASILALEKKVRFILSRIGCIHTSVKSAVFKGQEANIPFRLYTNGNDLRIKEAILDSFPLGRNYRLIAINTHTSEQIISKLKEYRPSDGYNESFKYALINQEKWFNKTYQYYFDSDSIRTYKVVSESLDTLILRRKNVPKALREKSVIVTNNKGFGKNVSVKLDSVNDLAILKISSFYAPPIFGKWINKNRYKRALKYCDDKGYTHLAIDLRNNTGGDAASGNSLLSFFVAENHSVTVKRKKGKVFKYAVLSSKIGSVFDFLFGNFFASRMPLISARKSESRVKKSRRFMFKGNTFIITNGFTVSTASNTASLFKYKTDAIVVGKETGGGENNLNAYFFPIVKLPFSKIKIQVPQYRIDLNVTENIGSGVVPDMAITYKLQDVISSRDLEIEEIIKMISLKQNLSND